MLPTLHQKNQPKMTASLKSVGNQNSCENVTWCYSLASFEKYNLINSHRNASKFKTMFIILSQKTLVGCEFIAKKHYSESPWRIRTLFNKFHSIYELVRRRRKTTTTESYYYFYYYIVSQWKLEVKNSKLNPNNGFIRFLNLKKQKLRMWFYVWLFGGSWMVVYIWVTNQRLLKI